MTWLTWRQHRSEVLIMSLVLLVFAAFLLITGVNIAVEARNIGATTCVSHQSACLQAQATLANYVHDIMQSPIFTPLCVILPLVLPALVGMFIGAPAIARELEHGTYRLVWTQGVPWSRWLLSKIGLVTCVVLSAFAILFGLFTWWNAPILSMPLRQGSTDFSTFFDSWGVVAVAYALFALMVGIFAGTVLRKSVPAMALTLIAFVLVRILIVNLWRPYYLPPAVTLAPINVAVQPPVGSWLISQNIVDRQGQSVPPGEASACDAFLPQGGSDLSKYNQCVSKSGLQREWVYQPADRFWLLQGIESGIYLLMTVMLFALTFWWTKHRIIGTGRRN